MQQTFTTKYGVQVSFSEIVGCARRHARRLVPNSLHGFDSEDLAQAALLTALPQLQEIHTSPLSFMRQRVYWCFLDLRRAQQASPVSYGTDDTSPSLDSLQSCLEARQRLQRLQRVLGADGILELAASELGLEGSNAARDAARYRLRAKARALSPTE